MSRHKYLGMVIAGRLEWTANVHACCKRASQRMFFLRKLRRFRLSSQLLHQFYRSVMESTMLFNQVCWCNTAKKVDSGRLSHSIYRLQNHRTAGRSPESDYRESCRHKFRRQLQPLADDSHPLHPEVSACQPSVTQPDNSCLSRQGRTGCEIPFSRLSSVE